MQIIEGNQKIMAQGLSAGHGLRSVRAIGMVAKTCSTTVTLLAVMVGIAFNSLADDPPLVYNVEFTGAIYPAPTLPSVANIANNAIFPIILPLPDPFMWSATDPSNWTYPTGRSTNFVDWSRRRSEIKAELEAYEIGYKPPVDPSMIFVSISGTGTTRTLTVRTTNIVNGVVRTLTQTAAINLPASSGTFPAIIGMDSANGSISLGGRPIATITYNAISQITQHESFGSPSNSDPYYALYAPPYSPTINLTTTGQYSAWAWGCSRLIDGLYKLNGDLGGGVQINLERLGVTGCSYAGKMALFCGALDERIALTIPQESGGGGAPNWRYSYQMEPAGSVEGLAQTSRNWFRDDSALFNNANTAKLPHDHHELLALVAPRALFATSNPQGAVWLSNPSAYVSFRAVQRVYETFGISDRFGYNGMTGAGHCGITTFLNADVGAFLDKFLLGLTNVNTITNRHAPESYATLNHARWTAWWGTSNPEFPYSGSVYLTIIPAEATEGDGTLAGQGLVSITPTPTNDMVVVSLATSDTNKVTVPASVVIPAGQSNAVFDLTIIDNPTLDGVQSVTITANSQLSTNGPQNKQIMVRDNETAALAVTLPASASQSAGTTIKGSVSIVGGVAGANIPITLTSSDTSLLQLGVMFIPKGTTSGLFQTLVVDNNIIGGSQNVTVTAHVPNWTNGAATMTILFDEPLPDSTHFAWGPISSSQLIGEPFPVTITALDGASNVLDYRLPVTLSALIPGNSPVTNTILNSPNAGQSATDGAEYVLGYSITPSTNLMVTHVRHYFGDRVTIWSTNGQVLASQNVVSVPGTWLDTSLPSPLVLQAGSTYLIMVHEDGVEYFWSDGLPGVFSDGTINQSWWDLGDGFPTQSDGAQWYFVDLRYTTDFVSVPIIPGATANFASGNWTGNITALQAGTNVILQARTGKHSSISNPFTVFNTPKLVIEAVSNSVVLSWPAAASGFTLQQASILPNWTDVPGAPAILGNRYSLTNTLGAEPRYFRLRKP